MPVTLFARPTTGRFVLGAQPLRRLVMIDKPLKLWPMRLKKPIAVR